jgi:plastocyanin
MTDDPKAPRPRQSLLLPVLIPVILLVGIGIVLWGFSRLLLQMEPHAATATALLTAAGIVTVVGIVASRKRVGTGSLLTVGLGVVGVAMLASGAALLLAPKEGEAPAGETVLLTITAPEGAAASGFQDNSLTTSSDTPFTIQFDNQDPSVEHDVVVTSADPAKDPSAQTFVEGSGITGVSSINYQAPPLPPGKYYFFCSFHPTVMTGTLTTAPGATEGGGGGVSTSITASGLQFDTDSLTFQAGKPTQFTFNNDDADTPHNLAIYTDDTAKDNLFRGKIITGVAKGDYTIPALKPGTYFFRCDVHTDMTGTVTVTPGGGGGEGPPPSGPPPTSAPPPSSGSPPPAGPTTTTVTASGIAFDTTTITLPANKATTLTFDNEDAGIPHNIAIFPDSSATNPLFTGDIVVGVKTVDYNISALKPGSYYFHCDVHPQMSGTVTVG